jgi:hypothetical protein
MAGLRIIYRKNYYNRRQIVRQKPRKEKQDFIALVRRRRTQKIIEIIEIIL